MKLLLTSSGISNPSIEDALVDLLGKPIAESSALVVPTAIYPFREGPGGAWRAITGKTERPFSGLGWKSLGVLELTALPSIKEESWVPLVRETDALLVWGGHVMYLCYWMRQSGLADLLPSLSDLVYVGVSAGSIVMTPYNGDVEFNLQTIPEGSDATREGDGRWDSSTSRCAYTSIARASSPWPTWRSGRPESRSRPTQSTTRPPSA